MRSARHPTFTRPRRVREKESPFLSVLASGLWRKSSSSTRSGERFAPHCVGSAEKEYCNKGTSAVRDVGGRSEQVGQDSE